MVVAIASLSILCVCLVLSWVKWKIAAHALSYYIETKPGHEHPTDEEIKDASNFVVRGFLGQHKANRKFRMKF